MQGIRRLRATERLAPVRRYARDPLGLIERIIGPDEWTRDCWSSWRIFLKAFFAQPLTGAELTTYLECTGRNEPPQEPSTEGWLVVGRRGGKSRIVSAIAVYLATAIDWKPYLAPGERGYILVIAPDRKQAKAIMGYTVDPFLNNPIFQPFLAKAPNTEEIDLVDNITIEVATCSYRTIRSRTVIGALCDEIAFWPQEDSATPDTEVIAAVKPCMATIPGAVLLGGSSPYARRGVLYDNYTTYFGRGGGPLVWHAPTRMMNSNISQEFIDQQLADDYEKNSAEYLAEFRRDIAAFVTKDVVDAVVQRGRFELAPQLGVNYVAFCDPSGGSSDSMTLAIGHTAPDGKGIIDCIREIIPPFAPAQVVAEFAQTLSSYRITQVEGDAYGGEWPRERFLEHGVTYTVTEKYKTAIYTEFLPLLNSGRVEYLDNKRLIAQTLGLDRRTARGGRDSIDHGPGAHDDIVNAAAGVLIKTAYGNTALQRLQRFLG